MAKTKKAPGKGATNLDKNGDLLGDDLLRRAVHRNRPSFLQSLALGTESPFGKIDTAKTAASYGARNTRLSEPQLAAIALNYGVGPYGLAVLAAKDAWEKWRTDNDGWKFGGSPERLRSALEAPLAAGEAARFAQERADAVFHAVSGIVAKYGRLLNVAAADRETVARAVGRPEDFAAAMVGLDGLPKVAFRDVAQTAESADKRGGSAEMKACMAKADARDVFLRFLDFRIDHPGTIPPTFDDVAWFPDKSRPRLTYRDLLRSETRKEKLLIVQVGVCVTAEDGTVAVIERDQGKGDSPKRISSGLSLFHSFSPDPSKPLRGQIVEFCRKFVPGAAAGFPLRQVGVVLNEVNVDAAADGSKPPGEKPAYLFFVAELSVGPKFPKGFALAPTAPADLHRDVTGVRKLTEVSLQDIKNHGDRAILLALRHPAQKPYLGSGGSWLIDVRHQDNRRWKEPAWPATTA